MLPFLPASILRHRLVLLGAVALLPLLAGAQSVPMQPWTIQPDQVAPAKSFDLNLLNSKYTGCEEFDMMDVRVENKKVEATFRTTPKAPSCVPPAGILTGPVFKMVGLAAGSYAIHYRELPACYPDCHAITTLVGPVDTLGVTASTALFRSLARTDGAGVAIIPLSAEMPQAYRVDGTTIGRNLSP